jgi:hypothetical protein
MLKTQAHATIPSSGVRILKLKRHFLILRRNAFLIFELIKLHNGQINSGGTFLTLLYVECHLIAFIEGFKTGRIYSRVMNEDIRSVFPLDEAETFAVIKPLYDSIGHDNLLLSKLFSTSVSGGCHTDEWIFPTE